MGRSTWNKTKTEVRAELQMVINELVDVGCMFFACPGPNKPVENMATCRVCWVIKDLRKLKREM